MNPLRHAILATLIAASPSIAAENTTTPPAGTGPLQDELPTVWVFAKAPRQLVEIAASVTVADEASIHRELAQDFRDLTRFE